MATGIQITFDANDPAALADFWTAALGYTIQPPPPGFTTWDDWAASQGIPEESWNDARAIVDPEGHRPRIFIQRVPEGKSAKNRVHLDLFVGGGPGVPLADRKARVDAEVERLRDVGATEVGPVEQRGEYWVVMRDPEGNEFCVE